MKKKKLLPKPDPPPEGYMLWYNELIPITTYEKNVRDWYNNTRDFLPDWRDDPTYDMRVNKRRKQNAL